MKLYLVFFLVVSFSKCTQEHLPKNNIVHNTVHETTKLPISTLLKIREDNIKPLYCVML